MNTQAKAVCYDTQSCIKCYSCVVACSVENRVRLQHTHTEDIMISINEPMKHYNYLTVKTSEHGVFPNVKNIAALKHCFHCENPKCMEICPTDAIKQDDTGAVIISESLCIGCRSCIDACPYDVPVYSKETGKTYKCVLCNDRLKAGLNTACADACPSVAIFSGTRQEVVEESKKRAEHYSKVFGKEFIVYGADKVNNHVGNLTYLTIAPKEDRDSYLLPENPVSKTSIARDVMKVVGVAGAAAVGAGIVAHTRHWAKNKENSPYNHHED